MKKLLLTCMIISCLLLLLGCESSGWASTSTAQVCCCRVTPLPREGMQYHVFQHFSMCVPPDYEVATNMDAALSTNRDPVICEQFCATMAALAK